jgi:hypothetical protein
MMRCRRPPIPAVLIATAAVVLAAGCGSSSLPTSSARPPTATTNLAGNAMAFAACVRLHGLTEYPDPHVSESAGHEQMSISPGGLDPTSPAFKSATHACGHLLPDGGSPIRAISPQDQAEDLRFASCMRTHGVPNFPDPGRDGAFTLSPGENQQAPQFQRATRACTNVEPSSLSILNQAPGSS